MFFVEYQAALGVPGYDYLVLSSVNAQGTNKIPLAIFCADLDVSPPRLFHCVYYI